MFLIHLIYITS